MKSATGRAKAYDSIARLRKCDRDTGPNFPSVLLTSHMQDPLVGWGNNLEESSQLVSGRLRPSAPIALSPDYARVTVPDDDGDDGYLWRNGRNCFSFSLLTEGLIVRV